MARYGEFVTAQAVGGITVQGAVISADPLRLIGESGREYDCVAGSEVAVSNPPAECIGCDLPLGRMCMRCREKLDAMARVLDDCGLTLSPA